MKRNEKQFLNYLSNHVNTQHSFADLKNDDRYNDLTPIKSKRNKIILGSSLLGATSLVVAGVIIAVFAVNSFTSRPKLPSLNLENYEVNLRDASGVGIIPLKENDNQHTFVKRVKDTNEIVPVDFLTKKNKKNNSYSGSGLSIKAISKDGNSFIEEQNNLGWVARNYLVYDNFTFIQFIPEPSYFNFSQIIETPECDISYEMFSDLYYKGEYVNCPTTYRYDDYNINHYIDGNVWCGDTGFISGRGSKPFIIDNDTGYIYSLEDVGTITYQNNALINTVVEDLWFVSSRVIKLSTSEENLIISTVGNIDGGFGGMIGSWNQERYVLKDRYGQYFIRGPIDITEKENKTMYLESTHLNELIFTSDHRVLYYEDEKLYEYIDNFEVSEVLDETTYHLSGYYSEYTVITNKYILDLPNNDFITEHYSYRYQNDYEGMFGAVGMINGYYFYLDNNNVLKYVKDPFSLYETYIEEHPREWVDGPLKSENADYNAYLESYSKVVSDDIVSCTPTDNWCLFSTIDNLNSYIYSDPIQLSKISINSPIKVNRWNKGDYMLDITEDGEISFVLVSEYVPENNDIILSPINN